ncbi:MAG: penicillin-binding protein 2 [Candidatus Eisenbacteria bacterium]|uniref:Penicillin-binding protein 2 n=1 Tax=Eiseniibacteriota bacterium TaxID=2212470 RepID=A0A538TJU8_UNCEI|nr:MAG: penicillin-binding protein 2 [Candidatus Eisenbacteria bacterium]
MAYDPESHVNAQRRERVFTILVAAIFGMVLLRLFSLQVLAGTRYRELSEENRIRVEVLTAPRGEIRDRKGRLMTDNVPSFTVTIDPYEKTYVSNQGYLDSTLVRLSGILGVDPEELIDKVKKERKQSFLVIRLKRNADLKSVAYVSEHRAELPGVEVEAEPLRRYPYGLFASHLLGYVGEISDKELEDPRFATSYMRGDLIGRAGIERQYESYLRGVDGKRFVEVNAMGRKAELLGNKHPILPKRGADVTLSIDLDLQRAAEQAFQPGTRGAVVALDPRTGEVLALASKPNYDPNEFSTGITQARWNEMSQGGNYPLFNRAIQAAYPPGSTLKPFVALAGLDMHAISSTTTFQEPCYGYFQFGRRRFGCWEKTGHGLLSLRDAIKHSCDVYFYQLGVRSGLGRISDFMKRLTASERTGIDLPQERRGLFPDPAWYDRRYGAGRWSKGLVLNLAIGQGEVSLTPIKLVQLTAVIASNGLLFRPHLLRQVTRDGVDIPHAVPLEDSLRSDLGLSQGDLVAVRSAMVAVVNEGGGTGGQARVDSVIVAGKTGTAQNPHGNDHALFICFAPAANPVIAVAVLVENAGHGSSAAAPLAQKVLQAYFHPAKPESAAVIAGN